MAALQFALGSQIAQIFRREIVAGTLRPGQRLIEHELSERFGVSRGPVRDALRSLSTEGLVEIRRGKASVVGMTEQDVDELYSLRGALESFAYDLVFPHLDDVDWSPFEEAIHDMQEAAEINDPTSFAGADLRFHQAIVNAAGHRRLSKMWGQMTATFDVLLEFNAEHRPLDPTVAFHVDLLDALRSADYAEADEAIKAHLDNARNRINGSRAQWLTAPGSSGRDVGTAGSHSAGTIKQPE